VRPTGPALADAFERAAQALSADTADRALDADLARGQDLLPGLAGLAGVVREPDLQAAARADD
jgi:hypothetical protein